MNNKTKARILIVLFTIVTTLDLVFTWIATPSLAMEANKLARWAQQYGLGWVALLLSNLVVLSVYSFLVWYSFVRYQRATFVASGFSDYINQLERQKTSSPFLAALGYAMGYSLLVGRMLPVIEWAVYLAGYVMPWYRKLKEIVPMNRPDLCLIVILSIVFLILWYVKEYRGNQKRSATSFTTVRRPK